MAKSCAIPKSTFPLKFKVVSPVHALELARKLIRPFKHWTTGNLATSAGCNISPKSAKAEAFCALGALKRVNTEHQKAAQRFLQLAGRKVTGFAWGSPCNDDIFRVNDQGYTNRTHKQVLQMFSLAIRLAKRTAAK